MKPALQKGSAEGEAKRACAEATNSEVDEFFALLQRIDQTEKQLRALRRANNTQELPRKEALVWRPSFEWEDFCSSGNGTRDVGKVSVCILRERAPLSNGNNTEVAKESLDLNLSPASSLK